jgi:hypothetical protein
MKTTPAAFGLLLACTLTAGALAAEPPPPSKAPVKDTTPAKVEAGRIDLRPKFELGQVTRYVMKQRSTSSVPNAEDPKKPTEVKQTQDVGLKMSVKSVNKETGEATVEIVYETVKATIDSDAMKMDYDSTKPKPKAPPAKPADPNDLMAALGGLDPEKLLMGHFEKMVGTTVTLTVDKSGRITKTTGGDTLAPTDLVSALGGSGGASPSETLQALFGPITSKGSAFDGTAKVGDKWKSEDNVTLGMVGTLVMATDYELRSARGNTAEVGFRGRVEPKSQGESSLFQVNNGTYTGQYSWDTKLGQVASVTSDLKMSISSQFTGGQPTPSTSTLTFERVKGPAK